MRIRPSTRLRALTAAGLIAAAVSPMSSTGSTPPDHHSRHTTTVTADEARTLAFEANVGQSDAEVRFLARGKNSTLFLTAEESVLRLREGGDVLRQRLQGANGAAAIEGLEPLPGRTSYYRGSDPSQWQTDVPSYAKVAYRGVYPGVDLLYYGNQGEVEYDLVVAPGADPAAIGLVFEGTERVALDDKGDLVLGLGGAEVRHRRPVLYQDGPKGRQSVDGRYVVGDGGTVGFSVGAYDRSRRLVIDPVVIVYSTYLGGNSYDYGYGIAVDAGGNAVVTGNTQSSDFPTKNPIMGYKGGPDDVFVTRFNPNGTDVIYSTYIGGNGTDEGRRVVLDAAGNAYLMGSAGANFPTTPGAFKQCDPVADSATFVAKLSPMGGLLAATCLGGTTGSTEGMGFALDRSGNAYITGYTSATDFPTAAPLQPSLREARPGESGRDAFVTKFNPSFSGLVYSTYLGGNAQFEAGQGIAVDASGSAYVTGYTQSTDFPMAGTPFDPTFNGANDVFVAKVNPSGSALVYSTYLGGSDLDGHYTTRPAGIAVDGNGRVTVAGATKSTNFPITPGVLGPTYRGGFTDIFVTRLNATGSGLVFSTYLGGTEGDGDPGTGIAVAVDGSGRTYIAGISDSRDFPTPNAARSLVDSDAVVAKLGPLGTALDYASFLGGPGGEAATGLGIALGPDRSLYVTGLTQSAGFPTTPDAFQPTLNGDPSNLVTAGDAFVTKFDPFLGFLRITTDPALPSQVTVDGEPRATWGTINLEAAPGNHVVCFRDVEGFTEPACQTVAVNNSAITPVAGTFARRGFLQVLTSPALPAKISVAGVARDDWGIYTDFAPGSYQVCFGKVKDFTQPACQTVNVVAGATTTVTGIYNSSPGAPTEPAGDGALRVTTNPALPSQIIVDGIPRGTWGLVNLRIAPGSHEVCYRDVEGYATPACQTVNVVEGQTAQVQGNFVPKGFLQVVTSPAVPAAIYVDGVARDDWGIFTDLPAGNHEVCFGAVTGYHSPPCQTVNLTGPTVTVTGTYTPA